jgi:probable rRNA maturation factor
MSPFEVEVENEVEISSAQKEIVRQAAASTLADQAQVRGTGCTVLLTGDEQIRALNRDFLEQDKSTDVLSFPAGEATPGLETYLGDIAISVPTARRQARSAGHNLDAELQLLTVHAVLHLLGYDHASADEQAAMWSAQARILAKLGAELTKPWSGRA